MRDIVQSTAEFESWLRTQISLRDDHLRAKHEKMAEQLFEFFRATFYRWCERWNDACTEWARAEQVVAIGDLHIANFGSWRDGRGRLIWGINDYDETATLSFAIDLVRLAASAEIASEIIPDCELTLSEICEAIRDGYLAGLEGGGEPFVLERRHAWLLRMVRTFLKEPKFFWKAWLTDKTQPVAEEKLPRQLATLLREALPSGAKVEFREMKPGVTKGLGSLGHDRFFSYTEHQGGPIAAEGKSVALSAAVWANGQGKGELQIEKLLRPEARPFSPGTMIRNGWLIRPLMSDCGRIDLSLLNVAEDPTAVNLDQDRLLTAMGFEIASLHLLSAPPDRLEKAISEFRVPPFRKTTETMIDLLRTDYKAWRKHWRDARGRTPIPASKQSAG
ncbi:MAG TPA: DUF2252 family protein [Chthoniobacterales bacterium]|nr:DUF2252 family protein [Chthoniobacterales bacterium]